MKFLMHDLHVFYDVAKPCPKMKMNADGNARSRPDL